MNECMHFIQKQCLCVSMPVFVYINDTLEQEKPPVLLYFNILGFLWCEYFP